MKTLLLAGLSAILAAAAPPSEMPLRGLTEADVGADALANSACYAHVGQTVLAVATKRNAVVNSNGDLLLIDRLGGGTLTDGARYGGTTLKIVISPLGASQAAGPGGRIDRPATIRIVKGRATQSVEGHWNCSPPETASRNQSAG